MRSFSTEQILEGIRRKNDEVLRFIYEESYPVVEKYILNNYGNEQDSEDVFQEALILVYRKVVNEELDLSGGFTTYVTTVCKHLWAREQKKRRRIRARNENTSAILDFDTETEASGRDAKMKQIIQKHLLEMDPGCKQLLLLFYDDVPVKDIKQSLGFNSDGYVRKRKYRCKKKLMDRLNNDPEFRDLTDPD